MLRSRLQRIDPVTTAVAGSVLVVGSLLGYQIALAASPVITTENIWRLEETAYVVLSVLFLGLALTFIGVTRYLQRVSSSETMPNISRHMMRLSSIVADPRSTRVFALSAICYGIFFGVVSSTLVFQTGLSFSDAYGVGVPSFVPVLCCGALGQMPQMVVYVTQHFAILIVPLNVILLFFVSWLVGLNASIASYTYANKPKAAGTRWMASLGAVIGLFTVCPTCAGFFFLTMIGLGGALTIALALSSLQTTFIAIGVPILMLMPYLSLRGLLASEACSLKEPTSR
jgi:hypothetical protein